MSNNIQRVLFAVIAIPIAIGLVYWGGLPLALLVSLIGGLGAHELVAIARRQGLQPIGPLAIGAAVAIPLGTWVAYGGSIVQFAGFDWEAALPSTWFALAGFVIAVLAATLFWRKPTERPLEAAAVTILAPLYCGVLPSFLLGIRYATGGDRHWPATWAVFLPLVVTWVGDTAAMYGGRTIKGPKLAPTISPGKTRSGSVAGLVGSVATAIAFNEIALRPAGFTISMGQAIVIGVILSVAGQIGDLAESVFKREVGIKDSSGLIPGHGGVLDRFDALYFVMPIAAMLYRAIGLI